MDGDFPISDSQMSCVTCQRLCCEQNAQSRSPQFCEILPVVSCNLSLCYSSPSTKVDHKSGIQIGFSLCGCNLSRFELISNLYEMEIQRSCLLAAQISFIQPRWHQRGSSKSADEFCFFFLLS